MRTLVLTEDPRDWRRFVLAATAAGLVLIWLLSRRGVLEAPARWWALGLLGAGAALALTRPAVARRCYRAGMWLGHGIGLVMGPVLLVLFFVLAVTPMGLLLRVLGKDLLARRGPRAESYWRPARWASRFDRMY